MSFVLFKNSIQSIQVLDTIPNITTLLKIECLIPFTDCELYIFKTLCDNHITFYIHNKYDELGNKHIKYILYDICSNYLISEYNIYSLKTFKCQYIYKIIWIQGTIPNKTTLRDSIGVSATLGEDNKNEWIFFFF